MLDASRRKSAHKHRRQGNNFPSPDRTRALRLIGIANVLLAMAREIEASDRLGDEIDLASHMDMDVAALPDGSFDHPMWAEFARQAYRDRRRRDSIFEDKSLFAEPAWDILLDLFVAAKEGRLVSVTSACIGAAVPSTTALRWIAILEEKGLLIRTPDTRDARRYNVRLTAKGYGAMVQYFSRASRTVFEHGFDDLQQEFQSALIANS